jgi:hypothetical protein
MNLAAELRAATTLAWMAQRLALGKIHAEILRLPHQPQRHLETLKSMVLYYNTIN